ncbi:hypothetical protein B7494_g2158 [Chlorociboria aeruginascens]|nr:hypothetical protein B7494_g2158 [Chlorociboria aeruginascens]
MATMANIKISSTATASAEDAVIIVGGGLAGLTTAYELTCANQKVIIVDQENEANLGGQAFWSLGGIFMIDTPQQRFMGVSDTIELARKDWLNSAQFDRLDDQDFWAVKWANSFIDFAHHGMHDYLGKLGLGFVPTVGWAERGDGSASGHGNSVPRFHVAWGTGPEVVRVFLEPVLKAAENGLVQFKFRHQVDKILVDESGRACGIEGKVLQPSNKARGVESSRESTGSFSFHGRAVVITTGGIGANRELIKQMWPSERLGQSPDHVVIGVPAHVDGRMIKIAEDSGARVVNKDRMWHYTEGLKNWNPIWPNHGIRVIPGPSSIWLDAKGERLPSPCFPGCDTLSTLRRILSTGYDYSWFVLNRNILEKEFMLSGSEQNPDLTGKSIFLLIKRLMGGQEPVRKFKEHGEDFVVRDNLQELVEGMNKLRRDGAPELQYDKVKSILEDRDNQVANTFSKDTQIMLINNALKFRGDRWSRCVKLHRILDPAYGPLVAVRMNILTRKTLGGIQTNLKSQVLRNNGSVFPGLIFERYDPSSKRRHGWGFSLHWSLPSLERTIGPKLAANLAQISVDKTIRQGGSGFLFLNAATCEKRYHVIPKTRYLRVSRQRLNEFLTEGIDIQYGKRLESFLTLGNGNIEAVFDDGTSVEGALLIGADGNNSVVRSGLQMETTQLTPLPVHMLGVIRHFTPEQAAPECLTDPDGRTSYEALVGISYIVKDPEKDIIPTDDRGKVAEMKKRAQGFAEPLLSMVMDIPDDSHATGLHLADFPCIPWNNLDGRVTLAGDSAHAMTMFRGEGANHGLLDAALLVDQLKRMYAGEVSPVEGLGIYEAEMQERNLTAVLKSRQAAIDAHDWSAINDQSPLVAGRVPPASAFT